MRNKPFYLKLFPLLAFVLAASFPVQIHHLYKIPVSDFAKIFSMLTPLNIMTMSSLLVAGILTLTLSKWVYKVIPILLFVLFTNNAIVGMYGTDYTLAQVAISFVLFAISLKPFYKPEIKAVILNPRFRWWNTPKRFDLKRNLELNSEQFHIDSETLNISSTGIFARICEKKHLNDVHINDIIELKIIDGEAIPLKAKIVRINIDHKHQPDGLGLEIIKDENHKNSYLPWFKEATSSMSA